MEQTNLPVVAKKIWNIVRAMYFLLRKGIISKGKLMADLNMMMKRGKIAGKAIHNLVFHTAHDHNFAGRHVSYAPREYEFSCSNSPMFFKRKHNNHHAHMFACAHVPTMGYDMANVDADMASPAFWPSADMASPAFWPSADVAASPALPGFGRTPARVRRVRITDSPFPLRDVDEDSHVDEAAEEFISKFYNDLKRQNKMSFR